jgi:dipeptidyl aminopeptidase/acylaminoacyl peptidase
MLRNLRLALCALLASGWAAHAAPLEAYGKLPNIEQAAISPSGTLIAFIGTDGDERSVVVESAADKKLVFLGRVGPVRLRDLTWVGDQHLILTVATARQPLDVIGPRVEYHLAEDLDLQTGRLHRLMDDVRGVQESLNTIRGYPEVRLVDGKPIVFVRGEHFVANDGRPGLFQFDLQKRIAKLIEHGDDGAYEWLVDPAGEVIAEERYKDKAGVWSLFIKTTAGGWREADKVAALTGTPDLVGVSRDGRAIIVAYGDDKTGNSWRDLALDTGAWGEPTINAAGEEPIADPQTGRVIGKHALVGDADRYTFFDPHDAAVWNAVTTAFAGDIVALQSWSSDHKKIVVRVDSARLGPAYALVDISTGRADWLGVEYLDLAPEDISARTPVRYKAADGLEISGYLTLPRGRDPHGLPLVVLPHGGPHARDEPGFDWWPQALASRGYAVLQPNFRGSDGFGWEFLHAGFGEWGRKMQTDLSDGVRYLAGQGVIDPKRVCIVGASYGGYAALAGATIDHGVYRCAVAVAGISNLKDMIAEDLDADGHGSERFWLRYVGAKNRNDPVLTRYSPALRANEADIPVLLIHGRDDTRVPISHSRQMADALRRAGKPVELIELPGEDHFLSRGETRLQMLKATVAFLEKDNPPN